MTAVHACPVGLTWMGRAGQGQGHEQWEGCRVSIQQLPELQGLMLAYVDPSSSRQFEKGYGGFSTASTLQNSPNSFKKSRNSTKSGFVRKNWRLFGQILTFS